MGRVAITGIGVVSPLGLDAASTWKAAIAGESGVDWIGAFDADQLLIEAVVEVAEAVLVETELAQDGGMQVLDLERVLDRGGAELALEARQAAIAAVGAAEVQ